MLQQLTPLLTQASQRKRGRKAKPRPIYVSRKIEVMYAKALLEIVEQMHHETKACLLYTSDAADE